MVTISSPLHTPQITNSETTPVTIPTENLVTNQPPIRRQPRQPIRTNPTRHNTHPQHAPPEPAGHTTPTQPHTKQLHSQWRTKRFDVTGAPANTRARSPAIPSRSSTMPATMPCSGHQPGEREGNPEPATTTQQANNRSTPMSCSMTRNGQHAHANARKRAHQQHNNATINIFLLTNTEQSEVLGFLSPKKNQQPNNTTTNQHTVHVNPPPHCGRVYHSTTSKATQWLNHKQRLRRSRFNDQTNFFLSI